MRLVVVILLIGALAILLMSGNGSPVYAGPRRPCGNCHFTHGAMGPRLIGAATVENLCSSCHSAAGPGLEARVHTNAPSTDQAPFYFTCVQCHNFTYPHGGQVNYSCLPGSTIPCTLNVNGGTQNLQGLKAYISTPSNGVLPVRFLSRGTGVNQPAAYSFADNTTTAPFDGICEVCHTKTNHHRYLNTNNDNSHNDGKTCTLSCHVHGASGRFVGFSR